MNVVLYIHTQTPRPVLCMYITNMCTRLTPFYLPCSLLTSLYCAALLVCYSIYSTSPGNLLLFYLLFLALPVAGLKWRTPCYASRFRNLQKLVLPGSLYCTNFQRKLNFNVTGPVVTRDVYVYNGIEVNQNK